MPSDAILLIEDDENDVYFMKRAFQRAGITNPVFVAEDGQKAIDYLQGTGGFGDRRQYPLPRLILLDLRLPFVPGLDVLAWIRKQPTLAGTIVIVCTTSKEERDIETAYQRGANAYIVKPADADSLVTHVQALRTFWLECNQPPPTVR